MNGTRRTVIGDDVARPVPRPDVDSRLFWDALRAHRLIVQQCGTCGIHRWPPRSCCPACGSTQEQWIDAVGHGQVLSWTVVHHASSSAFAADVPYSVALVQLTDLPSVVMVGNVVDCPLRLLVPGMDVEIVFDDIGPTATLARWRPRALADNRSRERVEAAE